jgi:NAD dependent epimerase/dehydratase family enzyme
MGTALGSGRQGFSWIHIEDLVRLILECLHNPALAGPINATAPHPCSNEVFTRLLAKRLHRPVWPVPGFLTEAALKLLVGEMAKPMLLGGAYILPKKALDSGFEFRFPQAAEALADLL